MHTHPLKAALVLFLVCFSVPARATQIINAGPSLSVVQGDQARFSAQFFDRDGNSGVSIRALHVASGQQIGQVTRNNTTGDLEWTCDTSSLQPGANQVRLVATDPAGASATVPFTLQISAASPVQHWRQTYFGTSQASGNAVDSADPDGDGFSNRAEFAFGTDPLTGSSDVGSRVESDQANTGKVRAIMRRRTDYITSGLQYIYEFSSDLQTWEASAVVPEVLNDDGTMQSVAMDFPLLSNGKQACFFRTRLP